MSKLLSVFFLFATLVTPAIRLPGNPASEAFREVAGRHSKAMLAAAKLMPADKYGYRPTPAQRSFGETIAHIVSDSRGNPGVRVQALVGLVDDWSDHYSQQAIYLRLNGILPPTAKPKTSIAAASSDSAVITRDGQRDFDFELGTWAIDMKRLQHPLSGSTTWTHPEGYSHIVQKVWDGQASLAQLANDRPSPHFDGLMLRMYDPKSHEWRIYWGSSKTGTLDEPLVGHFSNGRGEFVMHDRYEGKPILARVVYSDITPTSFRTESSFSADNGTSWEPNLVQTFTRVKK